jgi:Arc/MetJ-type ribon-helix-helix transcriptional regulator
MQYQISPELEQFIQEEIKCGRFASPTAVVEAGLARLMLDSEYDVLDEQDLTAIGESEAQLARGEDLDWAQVKAALIRKYCS